MLAQDEETVEKKGHKSASVAGFSLFHSRALNCSIQLQKHNLGTLASSHSDSWLPAGKHSGTFSSKRAGYFPQEAEEMKNRALRLASAVSP